MTESGNGNWKWIVTGSSLIE